MAVTWTEEQKRVIDTKGCNLLISAAAGSGKTAVLVARILHMITERTPAVDIDRLLIVTFTNAAASEMRERIRAALEERAQQEPQNVHLQRQLVLVHNAKIMTLHSFCLHVLRSHFQTAGIDPSFRIADEGEMLLLERDTVRETVNEAYEKGGDSFSAFLEQIATGKDDREIEERVLQLYHFALGQPFPQEWLRRCCALYEEGEADGIENPNEKAGEAGSAMAADGTENPGEETGGAGSAAAGNAGEASGEAAWSDGRRPDWMAFIEEDTRRQLLDIGGAVKEALRIIGEPGGPWPYESALYADYEIVKRLQNCGKDRAYYGDYARAFADMKAFQRLGTKKDAAVSELKKLQVQALRAGYKDQLLRLKALYYYDDPQILLEEFRKSGRTVGALAALTEAFMQKIAEKKAERNVLDFSDLEHFALKVLTEQENGSWKPSAVAAEYAEEFEEVMIDEYQDINLVQEIILNSVSGGGRGLHNLFMVGDVKQSIYRFRLARPELFMEKYRTYREEEAAAGNERTPASRRIDLHRNFRSRPQVLSFVNYIFRQVMTEPVGGVAYDREAALYPGAAFPEESGEMRADTENTDRAGDEMLAEDGRDRYAPELWLLDDVKKPEPEDRKEERSPEKLSAEELRRAEARLVGQRILALTGTLPVMDKDTGQLRPARCGDIVILLRSISGWAETFGEVLSDMGIACYTGSQQGYFSAAEIRTVLCYLKILDNPLQDIPLAAVLRSAIGNFTDEELSAIRIAGQEEPYFWNCCLHYQREGAQPALRRKLEDFLAVYHTLREKCAYTPVHLLLWELLDLTGYGEYAAALPAGAQRRANLDMLVEKAIAYEATSYRGLYHFVRYIENLRKYEVDFGEAELLSEMENTVRIMSIHKSKGLEFPIVFVCGAGKAFNEMDQRSRFVLHPDWGIGCDCVDEVHRTKQATLMKQMIRQKLSAELTGEELRILYVAMTRAREKLIVTGTVRNPEKNLETWSIAAAQEKETLTYSWIGSASSYLDWMVPALMRHKDGRQLLSPEKEEAFAETAFPVPAAGVHFLVELISQDELEPAERREKSADQALLRKLLSPELSGYQEDPAERWLRQVFDAPAPHTGSREIPGKLTVSELKKMSAVSEEADAVELYPETQETDAAPVPRFCSGAAEHTGAERGSVYHTFMENLNFSKKEQLEMQLEELISCGKMTQEEAKLLRFGEIRAFLRTETARRMERAAANGQLFREQPFVLGVAANEIRQEWDPQETVLVQGMIDVWFLEGEEIVLLDYKTDRVSDGQMLADRYRVQLDYYTSALERLTGHRVKERILYSFCLGKELFL